MATVEAMRQSSVDIDPDWYVGQPETAEPETAEPPEAAPASQHVPTVLTKLQKWGDYDSFGEPVWPSRFIPMKTPLSEEILAGWQLAQQPKHRLTVQDLLAAQKAAGRHVGLMLDLSNHDCLYGSDIPADVQYLHVQLVAKELPPLEFVQTVGRAANQYWAQHSSDYIAIHCAYGFNRTGFVVCSYLIEHCGLSVEQALLSFARSRPPGVKHEKFRDELHRRYDSRNQHVPRFINCSSGADVVHGAAVGGNSTSSISVATGCAQKAGLRVLLQQQQLQVGSTAVQAAGVSTQQDCDCSQAAASSTEQHVYSSQAAASSCFSCSVSDSGQCSEPLASGFEAADGPCVAAAVAAAAVTAGMHQQGSAAATLGARSELEAGCSSRQRPSSPSQLLPGTPNNSLSSCAAISQGGCMHNRLGSNMGSCSAGAVAGSPIARMPSARCYSSGSMGDNSSIGCSPDSSNIDLVITGGSTHSASSSVLGASPHLQASPHVGPGQQQQQAVAGQQQQLRASRLDRVTTAHGSSPTGAVGYSSRTQQQQEGQQPSIRATAAAAAGAGDDAPGGSSEGFDEEELAGSSCCDGRGQSEVGQLEDVDCFDLDPCGEPTHWRSKAGGSSSSRGIGCDGTLCCMQQQQQLLHASELSGLMVAVHLEQQQQQLQHQQDLANYSSSRSSGQQQLLQQQPGRIGCPCPCHMSAASKLGVSAAEAAETGADDGGGCSRSGQQRYSLASSDGSAFGGPGHEVLDNESFGKITSADLLKSLRGLQQNFEGS